MKLIDSILLSLSIALFLIGLHQSITVGFAVSYWIFMIVIIFLLILVLRRRMASKQPEKPKKKKSKQPQMSRQQRRAMEANAKRKR